MDEKGGPMNYFKCAACKARLYSTAAPSNLVGDLCPECGALLEAVGQLADGVGYRSIKPQRASVRLGGPRATREAISDRFLELLADRRASAVARTSALEQVPLHLATSNDLRGAQPQVAPGRRAVPLHRSG